MPVKNAIPYCDTALFKAVEDARRVVATFQKQDTHALFKLSIEIARNDYFGYAFFQAQKCVDNRCPACEYPDFTLVCETKSSSQPAVPHR